MPEPRTLDLVIADWRERAAILRKCRQEAHAELVEEIIGDVAAASEDFTRWISEADARMRSGRGLKWFRTRYPEWAEQGHARIEHGQRSYRLCVVPQRAHLSAAREAGRRAAGGAA